MTQPKTPDCNKDAPGVIRCAALLAVCPTCQHSFEPLRAQKFCSGKCRQKNFAGRFKEKHGLGYRRAPRALRAPKRRGVPKLNKKVTNRTNLTTSPLRVTSKGKPYIRVCIYAGGRRIRQKQFSIGKYGEPAARLMASLLRLSWIIETGRWRPEDGDALGILKYADSFKGSYAYEKSVVDDVSSPWMHEREDG